MAKWRHLTYDLSGGTASIRVLREKERQAIAEGINSRFDSTVAKIQKRGEIKVKNIRSWYLFRLEEASIAGMGETTHNDDVMPPNRT